MHSHLNTPTVAIRLAVWQKLKGDKHITHDEYCDIKTQCGLGDYLFMDSANNTMHFEVKDERKFQMAKLRHGL